MQCDVTSQFGEGQMFRVLVVTSACLANDSHWVMLYDAQWHVNVLRVVSPTHYHQLSEGQEPYLHDTILSCVCHIFNGMRMTRPVMQSDAM